MKRRFGHIVPPTPARGESEEPPSKKKRWSHGNKFEVAWSRRSKLLENCSQECQRILDLKKERISGIKLKLLPAVEENPSLLEEINKKLRPIHFLNELKHTPSFKTTIHINELNPDRLLEVLISANTKIIAEKDCYDILSDKKLKFSTMDRKNEVRVKQLMSLEMVAKGNIKDALKMYLSADGFERLSDDVKNFKPNVRQLLNLKNPLKELKRSIIVDHIFTPYSVLGEIEEDEKIREILKGHLINDSNHPISAGSSGNGDFKKPSVFMRLGSSNQKNNKPQDTKEKISAGSSGNGDFKKPSVFKRLGSSNNKPKDPVQENEKPKSVKEKEAIPPKITPTTPEDDDVLMLDTPEEFLEDLDQFEPGHHKLGKVKSKGSNSDKIEKGPPEILRTNTPPVSKSIPLNIKNLQKTIKVLHEKVPRNVISIPENLMQAAASATSPISKYNCFNFVHTGRRSENPETKEDKLIIITKDEKEPIPFVAFSMDFQKNSVKEECPKNCRLRFLNTIDKNYCSKESRPILQDVGLPELLKRIGENLRSGPYQCDWKGLKIPIGRQFILGKVGKRPHRDENLKFFSSPNKFIDALNTKSFIKNIEEYGYMGLDVEGVNKRSKFYDKNLCANNENDPVSLIHLSNPNGLHVIIQVNYDGNKTHGIETPKEILKILKDRKIAKFGFGITEDVRKLNNMYFPTGDAAITNIIEAGKMVRIFQPGSSKTGKEKAAEIINFTDVYPKKLKPCFKPNEKRFENDVMDLRDVPDEQLQYHYFDVTLALYFSDKLTLFLAKHLGMHTLSKQVQKLCTVAYPRSMVIAWLQNMTIWRGREMMKNAGQEGSQPTDAPPDLLKYFPEKNPFRVTQIYDGMTKIYSSPDGIATRLLQRNKDFKIPITVIPGVFSILDFKTKNFDPLTVNDGKNVQNIWTNASRPHFCQHCGEEDHDGQFCKKNKLLLICKYPYCHGDYAHITTVCPTLLEKCQSCSLLGHNQDQHNRFEFCVGKAFMNFLAYSKVHLLTNIVHHKKVIFTSSPNEFKLKVAYPKKGYPGDEENFKCLIQKRSSQ